MRRTQTNLPLVDSTSGQNCFSLLSDLQGFYGICTGAGLPMQRERDPQRGTSGEVTTAQRQLVYAQAYLQKKDDTEWDTVWGLISREVWFYGYEYTQERVWEILHEENTRLEGCGEYPVLCVQWNLPNTDTLGTKILVLIGQVSLLQGCL